MTRRQRLSVAAIATLLSAATGTWLGAVVHAADVSSAESIQVQIEPGDPSGPSGLAILAADDAGTAVQVLVPGAPEGTTAVIHPGTCDAVDPTLVGLVGEIGGSAQVQSVVPVSLGVLADGGHVIALHPGLDLATTIACGAIPAVEVQVPPLPLPSAPAVPAETVAPSAECQLVPEWIAVTERRLDRVQELIAAANKAAAGTDINAYLNSVAAYVGEVRIMAETMLGEAVPPLATEASQELLTALQTGVEAGELILQSFGTGDAQTYNAGVTKAQESNQSLIAVRTQVAELKARCP
jgi:hypothetical protein